jgi:uncharacterized protein
MQNDVTPVTVKAAIPTANGCALFLSCPQKTFVIYIDKSLGNIISMIQNKVYTERPMTHELILALIQGFGATIERVVINHTLKGTFFARLILQMKNEVTTKLVEVDARPSDCIILAMRLEKPIFVNQKVLDEVEDASEMLKGIEEKNNLA